MANMPYCRFENTYQALVDCQEAMMDEDLSDSEKRYRRLLIQRCVEIASDYGDELDG